MKKVLALILSLIMLISVLTVPAFADEREITVMYNGEKLEFDVPPMLINDRTMVPMRAIFEALNANVYWSDYNETVTGVSTTGSKIVTSIGSKTATINDKAIEIDSPPVLINGRTLVPLRFISESFGCEVGWDDATYTVTIKENVGNSMIVIDTTSYSTLGTWTDIGSHVLRARTDGSKPQGPEQDAVATFRVGSSGTYKVWVRAIDYAENQQGARYFNIKVNGNQLEKTFGQHGVQGFVWEDAGTIELQRGQMNELRVVDTAGFYARLNGIIITGDLDFVPSGDDFDKWKDYLLTDASDAAYTPPNFPQWANGVINETQVETIENDTFKINFYKGFAARGGVVQNEIFMKRNGAWTLVKDRTEDLGVLAMRAVDTEVATAAPSVFKITDVPLELFKTKFDSPNGEISTSTKLYYKSGKPEWLIPNSLVKVDEKTVKLGVSSENVDGTLTFSFDDLADDPKVTFEANMKTNGAYSFTYFSGDDFKDDSFEKVTAPLHYTQKEIPGDSSVIGESSMFTPMIAFTFNQDGKTFTKGITVDPTSVREYVARAGDQDFGGLFRSPNGNARAQIVAPIFGTEQCKFKAGDYYKFSYRILYSDLGGYETMKHVAEDLFNCVDLRENYYSSLNETIYNHHDLIMDDLYSGWDEEQKAFIYTESDGTSRPSSQSNFLALIGQYLLTEDEEFLDERAIPSLAFALTRASNSIETTDELEVKLDMGLTPHSGSAYVGMYQASQGRMPYLLNGALKINEISPNSSTTVHYLPLSYQALNGLTGTDEYNVDIVETAEAFIAELFDPQFKVNAAFVHESMNHMLNIFIRGYEETNNERYLKAATIVGEYIMQQIWTTGYQNDYATTDYTVDPEYTKNLHLTNDANILASWWFGLKRWRIGNPPGVFTAAKDCENQIIEESAPGYMAARTGMGTEHGATPSHAKSIYMNMWAGTILRLAKYTGDEFFATQARNAVLARSANYPGYYNDRLSLHDKRYEYPYEGPDFNMIFWHQVPAYLALLEDFLVNDTWYRSEKNIDFPGITYTGYAFFDTNQYGFAPGKFYDEEDMWLWLDRGIIEPDSVLVNYLPAKKDGTLAVALMNTDDKDLTTTITLGEKIPNASTFNEKATLLDKDGKKSTVDVVNGKFTVTIPAKGIMSVIMHPDVKKPSWVKDYTVSNRLGDTVSAFIDGSAFLLQFNDKYYHAFMCSEKFTDEVSSVTYTYKFGGQTYTETDSVYPFEALVKVPASSGEFTYTVKATGVNGETIDCGGGKLSPLTNKQVAPFDGNLVQDPVYSKLDFAPKYLSLGGIGAGSKLIRLVVSCEDLGTLASVSENDLIGCKVKGIFTWNETKEKRLLDSVVVGAEKRDSGFILIVKPYGAITFDTVSETNYTYSNILFMDPNEDSALHKIDGEDKAVKAAPKEEKATLPETFDSFEIKAAGFGNHQNVFRFIVNTSDIPFKVDDDTLRRVKIKLVGTTSAGVVETYYGTIKGNEMRDGGVAVTILVNAPDDFPKERYNLSNGFYTSFVLTLSEPDPLPI